MRYRSFLRPFALAVVLAGAALNAMDLDGPIVPPTLVDPVMGDVGRLAVRRASDISSSTWSIGCETLDRGYNDYWKYRDWLGATGAKSMRLQGGWARCEKVKGVYDFAWLDAIVDDARAQGVQPWIELSYSNPLYGGGIKLKTAWPKTGAVATAWDAWVAAMVAHFRDRVTTWSVWNEPDHGGGTLQEFLPFHYRTAAIVRAQQPGATIIALSTGVRTDWVEGFLDYGIANNSLHLVDVISYHSYSFNPDLSYSGIARLQALVKAKAPHIRLMQGESGAQSEDTGSGAMGGFAWNEIRQAKWDARRMLGDFCRGIPTNLFTLADYRPEATVWNRKGLLRLAADFSVQSPKQAWHTARHVFSLLDSTWLPDAGSLPVAPAGVSAFALRGPGNARVIAWWRNKAAPVDDLNAPSASIAAPGTAADELVAVDVRSGQVWRLPPIAANGTVLAPLYDSPILIGPRRAFALHGQSFSARINFQPLAAPPVPGYAVDGGGLYGQKAVGLAYGWNLDVTATARERHRLQDPLRDTLVQMQRPATPNASWQIAVPNGFYEVHAVGGDPGYLDSTYKIDAEGVRLITGKPTSANRFVEGTVTVQVTDGKLTLTNAPNSRNNKLCFIEITQVPTGVN